MTQHVEIVSIVAGSATFIIAFVSYLIHASGESEFVRFRSPRLRLIPWTAQNRLRKTKLAVEQEEATANLYDARFHRLQKRTRVHGARGEAASGGSRNR